MTLLREGVWKCERTAEVRCKGCVCALTCPWVVLRHLRGQVLPCPAKQRHTGNQGRDRAGRASLLVPVCERGGRDVMQPLVLTTGVVRPLLPRSRRSRGCSASSGRVTPSSLTPKASCVQSHLQETLKASQTVLWLEEETLPTFRCWLDFCCAFSTEVELGEGKTKRPNLISF